MATKHAVPAERALAASTPGSREDIRARRLYALSRLPRRAIWRGTSVLVLVSLDLAGLTLGLYAALAVREVWAGNSPLWGLLWDAVAAWLPFVSLITLLVFWRNGLYAERERRAGPGKIVSSLILVAVLVLIFSRGVGHHSPWGLVPTALVITTALVSLFRVSYEAITRDLMRASGVRRRAVLVGDGTHVAHLHDVLGKSRTGIDYEFVGAVSNHAEGVDLPLLGPLSSLPDVLARHTVNELIVTDTDLGEDTLLEIVEEAHRRGVKVRVAPRTSALLAERAEYLPGQGLPLFELRPPVLAGIDWGMKRIFDVVVSGLVIVVGLPLWLAVALAVKLTSPGPVFYADRRVGLGESEFGMLKFRTMVAGASERQTELEMRNEADGALFKIRNDPRVTPVGRVLRRLSLDEIPNVLNVLKGEMSLVGPRPLPVRDYALIDEWHRKRSLVLPGMSGLWQISGRSTLSFDDLVRLDFYYIENWSLWLDIAILLRTIPAVLAQRGAY